MLFLWPGTSTLLRGQGTYLTDEELDSVTAAASSSGEQNFVNELMNIKVKAEGEGEGSAPKKGERKKDELYEDAIEIVAREQRGSLSMLQRAMGIGYGRAARLIDYMEEDGYVGEYNGSKSREVLITLDMWQNIKNGDPNPVNDEDWPEEAAPVVKKPAASVAKVSKKKAPKLSTPQIVAKAEEAAAKSVVPKPKLKRNPASEPIKPKKLSAIEDPNRLTNMALNTPATIPMPDPKVEEEEEELLDDEYEYEYEDDDVAAEGEDDEYEYEYEYEEEEDEDGEEEEDAEEDEYEYEDEEYDEDDYEDVE